MSNTVDSTAVRVALWRALHLEVDAKPHILTDDVGIRLVNPDKNWRDRPDMHPSGTAPFRASIIARARFIEDFLEEESKKGIHQYVILGSGLDTFAQRKPQIASQFNIFEVDKKETLEWKQKRLKELGFDLPVWLKFIPFNFESNRLWSNEIENYNFDTNAPALITSIGVSMYLTLQAIKETFSQATKFKKGSIFIMTFLLPVKLVDKKDQPGYEMSMKGAEKSGTPFISFFSPDEIKKIALDCGFCKVKTLSTSDLTTTYFSNRTDGLTPSTGEGILIATL